MDNISGVIPPQLIELAIDVILPLIEACLKKKTPAEVVASIQAKDPLTLHYLRKSIRSKMDWDSKGRELYTTLINANPTDNQVEHFVNDFHQNKLDYLDLV